MQFAIPPGKKTGLVPRDYSIRPSGYHAVAPSFDPANLVPENEWADRLAKQQADKSSLYDLRMANYDTLKSLDQDGLGLCWSFSTTKAMMYLRAIMNEPPVVLSAWYVAGKVKGWQDQGGDGSESLDFVAKHGVPPMSACPSYSSKYDTSEVSTESAKNKATAWWDGSESRDMNRKIMISAFLLGLPPVLDYNWLSHSLCGCRLVSISPLVVDCDNSWGETSEFGEHGLYRMTGDKAIPDGVVVPRVAMASLT